MVLGLFEEGRQARDTAPSSEPRKVRPLAVRSGDMLALRIAREARVVATEVISEAKLSARGEAALTR